MRIRKNTEITKNKIKTKNGKIRKFGKDSIRNKKKSDMTVIYSYIILIFMISAYMSGVNPVSIILSAILLILSLKILRHKLTYKK